MGEFTTTRSRTRQLSGRVGGYRAAASLTTNLTGVNNDLTYTAKNEGFAGNSITVQYVAGGPVNRALSVSVSGNAITVTPATDGAGVINSTATAVRNAVNANTAAAALVTAADAAGNKGAGVVGTMAATPLTGGSWFISGR